MHVIRIAVGAAGIAAVEWEVSGTSSYLAMRVEQAVAGAVDREAAGAAAEVLVADLAVADLAAVVPVGVGELTVISD